MTSSQLFYYSKTPCWVTVIRWYMASDMLVDMRKVGMKLSTCECVGSPELV
jgi:hypothetical protein